MRRLILVALLLTGASIVAGAQEDCEYGGEKAFNSLVDALSHATSCEAAVAKFRKCAWGSSADTRFGSIVIEKCEKAFLDELSPAGKKRYAEEMQLCAYRYRRQEGTMWMAIAAGCQVDLAATFASNPGAGYQPAPHASFDCEKAQTVLEKAICSDVRLGHADIVLSRAYAERLKSAKQDRPTLIRSERQWLKSVPAKCGVRAVPLSEVSLNCVRNEFELRFTMLDSCVEKINECLESTIDQHTGASAPALSSNEGPSFDCGKPSTPLATVVCADATVEQAGIKLAQSYHDADKAMAGQHDGLDDSQRQWLQYVNAKCPMGAIGSIPPLLSRLCVRDAFETRIAQLQSCPQKAPPERIPCLNDFQLPETKSTGRLF